MIYQRDEDGKYSAPLSGENLFLVEGKDDAQFFEELAVFLGRSREIEILDVGGKSQMRPLLQYFVTAEGFEAVKSVTLVQDADSSVPDTIRSIQGAFENASLSKPQAPFVLNDASPRTAFLLTPNQGSGCLETVLWNAYEHSGLRTITESFLREVDTCDALEAGKPDFSLDDQEKRRLYPLLVVGRRTPAKISPKIGLKYAMESKFWDWGNVEFRPYREYIQRLP